ncbi:putative spliced leader RNA PSE-promoter transcription factor [Trypanosoma cruzi]|uniref:Spliced leader RNA PSE-promoter transcription factor, putative n=2 Tax=Trypanosoma cruzi TaxID=5693 RepID=Q4DFB5_TRYCC|nr:spliced leader RNA PSE-promoter transcription factor, putative [Trypanosoma cruzi]EAN91208.1 spliced leader RNA PSE-promoter transcription factor, putative [Trypanosoma cruzi]PWV04957.1 putative spliced leader RNA PSE-promoter transcription factor [Trypanosoma cruzi]RNC60923.1 putative spliced leader RNA PSE-promoter transcription factor PPB1 [Trypanosoma cruzi]|eukprot:XP_813059.1 spliced leader RNA PSE-promoter transcription factor [Trypanosoma cruzi strain CL Brener]
MRRGLAVLRAKATNRAGGAEYRPRFRPRRLVMPVNPNDVHSSLRSNNPLYEKYKEQRRLRKVAERRGSIVLATVPAERSVGDAFRCMLEVCEKDGLFSESISFTPKHLQPLEQLLKKAKVLSASTLSKLEDPQEVEPCQQESSLYAIGLSAAREMSGCEEHVSRARGGLTVRDIDTIWRLLDRTPLDSPVHGILSNRGKALVENCIASMAQEAFPRLRSKHLQALLHECCGLLACGRVALRLGFADMCNVSGEISMWRELNVLTERFNIARRKAAAHLQRIEKGVPQQRRWYWRGVLRSAAGRLKLFPVHKEDLIPRMEWIRGSVFAFVAFIEMAEQSGDGVRVEPLIRKLFCSQLGSFLHVSQIVDNAQRLTEELLQYKATSENDKMSSPPGSHSDFHERQTLANCIKEELEKLRHMTEDELEVLSERTHPLNTRADARRDQFASSGGAHATQSLRDDIFDDYRVTRHHKEAPPAVLHCIRPQNALKEAQIILRYDPNVPKVLSSAPIDVDQVVRRVTEVHETNPYASLHSRQQFRQVEYTVCRLYAGTRCIGQGKGETLMEAMNEAAQHTLLNYYLKEGPSIIPEKDSTTVSEGTSVDAERTEPWGVRVNKSSDEEIFF